MNLNRSIIFDSLCVYMPGIITLNVTKFASHFLCNRFPPANFHPLANGPLSHDSYEPARV